MERVLSTDERIRKAEEIYERRRASGYKANQTRVNVGSIKNDYKLFRKMFIQLAICSIIYISFYVIKNNNYIFSEAFLAQAKDVLNYDINLKDVYENVFNWFSNIDSNLSNEIISANDVIDEKSENIITTIEDIADAVSQEEPILAITEQQEETTEPLSDVDIIRNNYSIIKPLTGTITSRFGERNPTTPTVPIYHTGIDIAANTGTVFIAAMSGKVVQVSSEGDYGNHLKIEQDDIITLYAHCSKIYVNEGDEIVQGQEIGEVGETGNTTGPHLHFEIRKAGEYINPDDILDF